jgi:two-component system OmpR family response regulator
VEDDTELANVLTQYLATFNIKVTNYEDPFLALSSIAIKKYDLIILDLTLPGLDGLDVCKKIIQHHDIPIIISSARSDITDKVVALQMGADDYLPKPYDPRELEIRIRTILRRYNNSNNQIKETKENKKKFIYCEDKKIITKDDKALKLTQAEFDILSLLIKREEFVVSREEIFDECESLNIDSGPSSSLSVIINRLRSKIEENSKEPKYLQTVRGMGYKFTQNV